LRVSNKYHKFVAYGQRKSGNDFETLKYKFYFDYYEGEIMKESAFMFKGFTFGAESRKLITQYQPQLEANDRIYIDGEKGLITKIHVVENHTLGGQRFKTRKKTYVIELET
jgi:hypothetical protein